MKNKEENVSKDFNYQNISKINTFIYLGSYEHPLTNSLEFQKIGIDVVINCAKEIKYSNPENTKYRIEHFSIIDGNSISFLDNIDEANDKIHKYLTEGKNIYIHCDEGISRSPAILIFYLIMNKRFNYDDAYDLLKQIRPIIDIDPEFESSLRVICD